VRQAYQAARIHLGAENAGIGTSEDATVSGTQYFTTFIEVIGDVTGDGYGDLTVSNLQLNHLDTHLGWVNYAGIVAILPGAATLPASTHIDATGTNIVGDNSYDRIGMKMAEADVDGDGVGDLLVSNYNNNEPPRLFYGPISTGTHLITTADARFTDSNGSYQGIATAGDTNNDGYEDFLVGRINDNSGPVHLFLGAMN